MRVLLIGLVLVLGTVASRADAAVSPRFRRLVAVGDSLFAGFASGGLTAAGQMPQRFAAPAQIARRARTRFPLPLMRGPGVPPPYRIRDDDGDGRLGPGEVRRTAGIGFRREPRQGVRNLAVPGESVTSVADAIDAQDVAQQLVDGDVEGRDAMKFLILGLPLRDDAVSQLTRARELDPTMALVWLGNNDYLQLATEADPDQAYPPTDQFGRAFRRVLDALSANGAALAVANLPDATRIPALRRADGEVTACRRADGTEEPVAADDLLPVALSRDHLPVPPCNRVLNAAEQVRVRGIVSAANAEIDAAIAEAEARGVEIARVDVATVFEAIATGGYDVRGDGSLIVDARYLGGVFSLDGTHPTRTGQALVANAFIDAINGRFGEALPRVDVARVASQDPLVGSPFRPSGEPPFGLFADEDAGDAVENALDDVRDDAGDLADDLLDRIGDFFDRF